MTIRNPITCEATCEEQGGTWWNEETETCELLGEGESPILIPLGRGQDFRLTSAEDGVAFDIDANGSLDHVAWTRTESEIAFLALDRNGNGVIDDASELFGNHTVAGKDNGFDALAALASELEGSPVLGSVKSGNKIYARLLLWVDSNHNGYSEQGELTPFSSLFTQIGLGYQDGARRDQFGNRFRYKGWVELRTAPGPNRPAAAAEHYARVRNVYEVFFVVR